MKRLTLLFCFVLILSSFHGKKDNVLLIEINKIPFYVEFPMAIDCDDLTTEITGRSIQTYTINDKKKISMILNCLKRSNTWDGNSVDTRAKLYIHYQSGKIDTVCVAGTGVFSYKGNVKLLLNRRLVDYLDNLGR